MYGAFANILAAAGRQQAQPVPPPYSGLLEALGDGQLPQMLQYANDLARMHEVWAVVLILAGLIYLLGGWKIYKFLVTVNGAALGALLGNALGARADGQNVQIIITVAGALLLGVIAWQMLKASVSLMGALAGATAGYGLWTYAAQAAGNVPLAAHAWAGALLGFVTVGLLALVAFKHIVMIFTAYQGAVMCVSGVLAMMVKPYLMGDRLRTMLVDNQHLLPILLGVPTVLGYCLQYTAGGGGKKKKDG